MKDCPQCLTPIPEERTLCERCQEDTDENFRCPDCQDDPDCPTCGIRFALS